MFSIISLLFSCSFQQYETKRSELPANAGSIYDAIKNEGIGAVLQSPFPRSIDDLDGEPFTSTKSQSGVFEKIYWLPDGNVRGTYAIEVTNQATIVHAWSDLDKDGIPSHLVVTEPIEGKLIGKWLPKEGLEVKKEHHKTRGGGTHTLRAVVWLTDNNVY